MKLSFPPPEKFSEPIRSALSIACSLLVGALIALVLHYLLYRLGLPSKPFIYVVF